MVACIVSKYAIQEHIKAFRFPHEFDPRHKHRDFMLQYVKPMNAPGEIIPIEINAGILPRDPA